MKAAHVVSRPSILPARAARSIALAMITALALLASVLSTNAAAAPYNFTWSSSFSTTVSGAHPNMRLTFASNSSETLQTLQVDLPAGLMPDPSGASACTAAALAADTCPGTSEIGSATTRVAVGPVSMQVPGTIYRVADPASSADADFAVLLRPPLSNLGLLPKLTMRGRVAFTNGGGIRNTLHAVSSVPFAGGAIAVRMAAMNMQFFARQPVTGSPLLSNSTHCVLGRLVATATTRAGSTGTMTSTVTPTGCATLPFSPTADVTPGSDMVNESTSVGVAFGVGAGTAARAPAHIRRMRADLSELGTFDLDAFDAMPGCSDAQATSAGECPADSQIGTLTTEIAGFGARPGRIFHMSAPGHTVLIELSLRKDMVEWIKGSLAHRSSGGGAILTIDGLPQLPFAAFQAQVGNQAARVFRTRETCSAKFVRFEMQRFDGTAIPIVRGSALHGCPPTISLIDAVDRDDDDDGYADGRYRPAFFDVFFDVADAGSGVESVECTAVAADGSRSRLRVVPTAQTTGRYVCNAEDLPEGDVTLEIAAYEHRGHVTVLKMSVTVDTTAPAVSLIDPADQDCDGDDPTAEVCYRPAFFDVFFTATDAGSGVDESKTECALTDGNGNLRSRGVVKKKPDGDTGRICEISEAVDGDAVVEIRAVDWRGHVTVLKMSVTIDGTAPAISIDEPGVHFTGDPDFDLLMTVYDKNLKSVTSQLAGEDTDQDCDGTVDEANPEMTRVRCHIHAIHAGADRVMVTATDAAGNKTSSFFDVFLDLDKPSIAIDEPGAHISGDPDFDLLFVVDDSSLDAGGSFDISCERKGWDGTIKGNPRLTPNDDGSAMNGVCSFTGVADGEYELVLSVTDAAGHVTVLKTSVIVDTTAPEVEFFDPGSEPFDGRPWLFFNIDDANPGHSVCRLFNADTGEAVGGDEDCDGYADSAGRPCDPDDPIGSDLCRRVFVMPHVLEASGRYRAEVTHTDLAGHSATASVTIEVDTVPPSISIDEPGVHITGDPDFDLLMTVYDKNLKSVTSQLVGDDTDQDCDGTVDEANPEMTRVRCHIHAIHAGADRVMVTATDAAGNKTSSFFDVFLDLDKPSIAIDEPGAHISGDPDFDLLFVVDDSSLDAGGSLDVSCERRGWDGTVRGRPPKLTKRADGRAMNGVCSFTGVADGEYELVLSVTDAAGHVTVLKTSVIVDTTAPEVEFFDPGSDPFGRWPLIFIAVDDANPGHSVCRLFNADTGEAVGGDDDCDGYADSAGRLCEPDDPIGSDLCRRVFVMPHVLEASGHYRAEVTHTDLAGHSGTASVTFEVDTVPPAIAIDEPGVHFTSDAFFDIFTDLGFTIDGRGHRDVGGYRCGMLMEGDYDGISRPTSNCVPGGPSPIELSPGLNHLALVAADAAGNLGAAFFDVFYDATSPVVTITDPTDQDCDDTPSSPDACYRPAFFDIFFDVFDEGSGVEQVECYTVTNEGRDRLRVQPTSQTTGRMACVAENMPEGEAQIEIVAVDRSGRRTTVPRMFTVDSTAPEIAIDEEGLQLVTTSFFDIFVEISDASPVTVACLVRGGVATGAGAAAGAASVTCGSGQCSSDVNAPCDHVQCAPLGDDNIDPDGDGKPEFRCRVSGLVTGNHTFIVVTKDAAGNTSNSTVEIVADLEGPVITLDDPKDQDCDGTDGTSAPACYRPAFFDVFFTATDAGSGVDESKTECAITDGQGNLRSRGVVKKAPDGGTGRICQISGAVDGDAVVEIRAVDWRGHVTVLKMSVTIDGTVPEIAIDEPGAHFTTDSFFDVFTELGVTIDEMRAGDPGLDPYRCDFNLDGDFDSISRPTSNCAPAGTPGSPPALNLTPGPHRVGIRVEDAAGNLSTAFFDVFYDAVGPVITLDDPKDQDCDSTDGTAAAACFRPAFFDVFFTATDEGSGVDESKTECAITDGQGNLRGKGIVGKKPAGGGTTRLACEISGAVDGDVVVEIRAVDWRGHVTVLKMSVTIDDTAPVIEAGQPEPLIIGDPDFDLLVFVRDEHLTGIVAHDDAGECQVVTDPADPTAARGIVCQNVHHNERRRLTVTATDAAGNTTTSFFDVFVDVEGPVVTLADPKDQDCDSTDGTAAAACFRPAFFDVFFEVADDESGVSSVTCDAVSADGKRDRLRVIPTAQTTGRLACSAEGLPDGDVTLEIGAADGRGHVTVLKMSVTVDGTPPAIAIDEPGVHFTGDSFFDVFTELSVSIDDKRDPADLSEYRCYYQPGDYDGISRPTSNCAPGGPAAIELAPGLNRVTLVAIDAAGNRGHESFDVYYDTEMLVAAPIEPVPHIIGDPDFDLLFTVDDDSFEVPNAPLQGTCTRVGGGVMRHGMFSMDATTGNPRIGHCSFTGMADGDYEIEVSLTDGGGHVAVLTRTWTIDSIRPEVVLTSPIDADADNNVFADAPFRPAFFDVFFSATDTGSGINEKSVACELTDLQGRPPTKGMIRIIKDSGGYACHVEGAAEGDVLVTISAKDNFGHVTVLKRAFTVDTTAPDLAIAKPPTDPITGDSFFDVFTELGVTIDGRNQWTPADGVCTILHAADLDGDGAPEEVARVACPGQGGGGGGGGGSIGTLNLAEGENTITIDVSDAVGNPIRKSITINLRTTSST